MIVGGGFGGMAAARRLEGAADVEVTVMDRMNHHLFQPLLYQVATASLSPADIASPIRWILRRQRNVQVLLAEVRAIDPAGRRVTYSDANHGTADVTHEVSYDYLIVAAGARRDMGQTAAAIQTLEVPELTKRTRADWLPRLRYAYADELAEAGRTEDGTV